MDRKELKKLIKAEFGRWLKDLGFSRKGENMHLKIHENIIQNISFEFGSIGFTCVVAMQPLYIKDHAKTTFLHFSFGKRLSRFKIVQREWWSYEEPEKGIAETKKLLTINGLPWFEEALSEVPISQSTLRFSAASSNNTFRRLCTHSSSQARRSFIP